jgi:nitrate/nitrite-specific signal transduction histidine kinase
LGHAILKMRDDLESNEQELEGKVQMRTAEVEQQKSALNPLYVDLKDSINYAERIQKAICLPRRSCEGF